MRLIRAYSLMRRVVGRLRSFMRNCFIISNFFPQLHHLLYHRCHIIIFILRQSAAKHYIILVCSQFAILVCKLVVTFVVHWVVWLHAVFILCRIFLRHNRLRTVVNLLTEHLKVLVLYHTCVGLLMAGIINDSIALEVRSILYAGLETYSTPVEFAQRVVEILVDGSCVNQLVGKLLLVLIFRVEEIDIGLAIDTFQQSVDQLVIASYWYALILVVEVVVVEDHSHRQTLNDERR